MSIWLGRLQRDDSALFLYFLNTLFSWLENETNSFFITPKPSQKHFSNKVDTFRYLRCRIWTRRSYGKWEIKILPQKVQVHLVGETSKRRFWVFSLHLENTVFLAWKRNKVIYQVVQITWYLEHGGEKKAWFFPPKTFFAI